MKQVYLQQAFILHRRAYRETSFLLECFSKDYGRLSLIARGARQSKHGLGGLLQAFTPLLLSWSGKTELMYLSHAEFNTQAGFSKVLTGKSMFAGLYLNELLVRLLPRFDPAPNLFISYERTLSALHSEVIDQKILRTFELHLLEELGYGLFPKSDALLESTFLAKQYYCFIPERGLVLTQADSCPKERLFLGEDLLAFARGIWHEEHILQEAKRLTRLALSFLLGNEPLQSRKLFV